MAIDNRKLILGIDYSNILISSYFSKHLINSIGLDVNAIIAFFHRLDKVKNALNPNYIIITNDIGRDRTFRRKLYSKYKANRKDLPEDIEKQIRIGLELVRYLGYPIINHEEYEADDILGMISKLGTDNNMITIIASSDKDFYQLISDSVFIYNTRDETVVDEDYIKYNYGLYPKQLIDVKALSGDPGDNVPGAPGVGNITALKLIKEFGTLDNLLEHKKWKDIKLQERIENNIELIKLSKQLVTIITDYTLIDLSLDKIFDNSTKDSEAAFRLLGELEIPSLVNIFTNILKTAD